MSRGKDRLHGTAGTDAVVDDTKARRGKYGKVATTKKSSRIGKKSAYRGAIAVTGRGNKVSLRDGRCRTAAESKSGGPLKEEYTGMGGATTQVYT